jgi:hypothetical protein
MDRGGLLCGPYVCLDWRHSGCRLGYEDTGGYGEGTEPDPSVTGLSKKRVSC